MKETNEGFHTEGDTELGLVEVYQKDSEEYFQKRNKYEGIMWRWTVYGPLGDKQIKKMNVSARNGIVERGSDCRELETACHVWSRKPLLSFSWSLPYRNVGLMLTNLFFHKKVEVLWSGQTKIFLNTVRPK